MFEALAAYANMGDASEDWRRFRLMYPDFFPMTPSAFSRKGFQNVTEWMYEFAEEWQKYLADLPPDRRPVPPLLWYRNRLRAVWARNDQHGYSLAILLGFEQEAKKILAEHPSEVQFDMLARPLGIPGQSVDPSKQDSEGLPQGKPVINGVTGEIRWEFGCDLQQAVYELMQYRWRAKVCPKCGRFFIAAKTAQTFCSVRCSEDAKRDRALTWWNETGSKRRSRSKARKK
ncbi:MAG TPA: hypothetical protein VJW96_10635 [Terriglobales bacterium]|nr:hypothetical protein [Terriglobales bacterium]